MVRAVQPSRTVWFWALIAGVVSLLSSAALLWNSQRVQRLHFTQAQGASLAALTQQLNAYDALLAQVAQSETPPRRLPAGILEAVATPAAGGLSWQVGAANLAGSALVPGASLVAGMPSKANQNLADLFAMSAPERGLMLSLRGCEAALPCSRWWLAFIPLSTLPGASEPGWQLLKEEAKGLKPIWPPQQTGVLAKDQVQLFTWREQRYALYRAAPHWPWLGSVLAGVFSVLVAALTGAILWGREQMMGASRQLARSQAVDEVCEEALFTLRPDGKVSSWSRGAILLWEYGPREVIGRPLAQLFSGTGLNQALAPLGKGKPVRGLELKAKSASGEIFAVQLSAVPIQNAAGQVVGAALSAVDLRPQHTAQTRLLAQEKMLAHSMALLEKNNQRCLTLEQARRHLQTVLDAVPFVIGYWDKNQINQVANKAHHGRFGVAAADIPGMSLEELLSPEDYKEQFGRVQAALAGMPQTYEYTQVDETTGAFSHYLGQYLPDTSKTGVRGFYVIEQDITELVEGNLRLGRALEENDVLLTTINNQLLYSVTDVEGVIQDVNDNYCAALGFERAELLGQTHRLVNSGVHPQEFWQGLWESLLAGKPWRAELCNRTKSGEERWFDTVIAPFHGQAGKVEKCVALSIDITSRKAVEQEHQRLGQLLRDVLEAASEVAIIATDTQGAITLFNTGAERMLGYSAEEMLGERPFERLHLAEELSAYASRVDNPEDLSGFALLSHQALELGPQTQQWTYVRKDASQLKVSLTLSAMRGQDGVLVGFLIVAADITESLKQQQALISAKDQLMAAAEVAELGVWEYLPGPERLHWNERMFEIFGQPLDEPPHSMPAWFDSVHPDERAAISEGFARALAGTGEFAGVYRFITAEGSQRYVQFGAYFERDLAGAVFKVTGISRDITGQQELENRLRQAKEQADAANLAKSQFLANMSHEIRTPMNAVLGMLQLVRQTQLGLRQQDYVNKAQTAAKSLLGLLNDILDFSKIDAGKLVIDPTCCSLDDICAEVAVVMAGNQGDKPVEVIFDLAPELPQRVLIDKLRIQQVLINLIGNALKFTAQGQVWVQLSAQASEPSAGRSRVRFTIRDTGIGIREDQQKRIFDGFVQAEASTTRRYGGTGLGLVITKNLIELMGGQLHLTSELGQGSEFSFELSLPLGEAPNLAAKPSQAAAGSVLLVHETPLAIEVLERDLTRLGFQVTSAHSAADALSLTEGRARAGEAFTLALVDWRLSDANGLALARQLHTINPEPLGVILLLTQREKEQLAQHQGHDAQFLWQLSKPIVRPALEQVISLVLAGDQAAPDQSATPQLLAGLSLLVVEDNALNRQVAAELLGGVGAKVSLAVDGRDGVNKATARGAAYDLILMDLQMPVMDGLEATRQLRTQGRTLPILAMTANASAEDKDECLAAGMDGHLSKPIDLSLVVAAIRQALGKTGQAATQPEGAAPNGLEAALNAQPVDTGWEELADALAAESDSAFDEPQAEAAEPVPDAQEEHEGHEAHELPVAQGLEAAIETPALSEEELDLSALEALPVVDFSDLLGDALDGEPAPEGEPAPDGSEQSAMAPAEELGAEQGQAQSQDDLTKDAQGDLSLEAEPPTPDQFEAPPVAQPSELSPAATPTPTPGQPPAAEPGAGGEAEPSGGDWVDGLEDILRRFGGKRALYQKMLANLGPETGRLIDELHAALAEQDRPRACTAAHSIKGTAATLGAKALSQRAAWLEKRLKASQGPLEEILTPEAFDALAEALNGALTALDQALAA